MYVLVLVVKPFTSSRYARWLLRLFRKPVERGTKRRRFFKRSLDLKNPGRHFRRRRFVRSQVGRNKREDIFFCFVLRCSAVVGESKEGLSK